MEVKKIPTLFERIQAFVNPPLAKKPTFDEISVYKSPYYAESYQAPYNPDELYQKKGGLDIYTKMMTDDQVKAVLTMKKHAVLSTGWQIETAGEETKDKEVRDFVYYCLTDGMKGSFKKNLLDILTALQYGFSVTEKVYQIFDSGKYEGKLGFKHLKSRPPHSFLFDTDNRGNLKTLIQHTNTGDVPLDPMKFVIYSYNSEFGNYYGNSDLRAAYRSWFSKDIIIKFWNIYLERFGMPIAVGTYPTGASSTDKDNLDKILKNLQEKTAMKLPEGLDVKFLEATRRGDAGYLDAIEKHNIMIARAVLLPDLLGYSETKGGSYNLGEKHFDVFLWILENLRSDIEETIMQEQIIKPLVVMNYAVENYPKFKFNPLTAEDKKALLQIFINAVEKGVVSPTIEDEAHIRESTGFPKRQNPEPEHEEFSVKLNRKPNAYEQKVNFSEVARTLDDVESITVTEMSKIVKKMRDDLISTVYRRKIVEGKDYKEIDQLTLKYLGDFRLECKDFLRNAFLGGQRHAKAEIKRKEYAIIEGGLPPANALDYFERKAFFITGVERDYILKDAKLILYNGIKFGKSNKEVMFELEQMFEPYFRTSEAGAAGRAHRLETIVRTNTTDAYNQARKNEFREDDFVVAMEYSAVLDDRTTDFCREHDGRIYKKDDPYLDTITPPNDFNCRSLLVPVLADEEFIVDKHLAIKPAEGFY